MLAGGKLRLVRILRACSGEPVGVSPRTIWFAIRPGANAHRLAFGWGFRRVGLTNVKRRVRLR